MKIRLKLLSPDGAEGNTATIEAPSAAAPVVQAPPKTGRESVMRQLEAAAAPKTTAPAAPVVPQAAPVVKVPTPGANKPVVAAPAASPVVAEPAKPAPTAAAVAATGTPEEIEAFKANLSGKSRERFLELARKEGETLAAEKMKSVKLVTPEFENELRTAKEQSEKYLAQLKEYSVLNDPIYQDRFVERPKAINAQLATIAKTYDIPESQLFKAIEGGQATRADLNVMLESVGSLDRSEAADLIRELQKLEVDKSTLLKDTDTSNRVLREQKEKQLKEYVSNMITARTAALETKVLPEVEKEFSEIGLFQDEATAQGKVDFMANLNRLNGMDLERAPHEMRAALLASSLLFDPTVKAFKAYKETASARIAELEGKLAEYDTATPPIGGGKPPGAPKDEKPLSFIERAKRGQLTM